MVLGKFEYASKPNGWKLERCLRLLKQDMHIVAAVRVPERRS